MTSVEVLQTSAEALRKSLSAGNPSAAEISAVRTNVQPAFLSGPGTRESLARLHTQIDNHVRYLDGIGNARNAVQNSTLTELQQLSTTLTGQGILERHVNVDTGNPTLNTGLNRVLNGPYEIARRVFNASSTTAHYVSLGAGALGLYTAWRLLKSMGGRAYRGVRRATSGWFGTAATIGATVAGVLGIQHLMGNRASAAPLSPDAKKTLEDINKTGTAVNSSDARLNNINLLQMTAPLRVGGNTIQFERNGALSTRISINGGTPRAARFENNELSIAFGTFNDAQIVNIPGANGGRYVRINASLLGFATTKYVKEEDMSNLLRDLASAPAGAPYTHPALRTFKKVTPPGTARAFQANGETFDEDIKNNLVFNRV